MAKTKAELQKAWLERNPNYHAEYREKNRLKRRQWNNEWIANNRDAYNSSKAIYRDRLKLTVMKHYGEGVVACKTCGEKDIDCLVLDHVNNDGAAHRKLLGVSCRGHSAGIRIYEALSAAKFPAHVLLQVLCANCNLKKQVTLMREKRLKNPIYAERHGKEN
jgi:hypothetical protein